MIIRHLTAADFRSSTWSGGTTTELYLHPEHGSYAARDFLFRISSATVDLEESDFTPLQGVERYITPLEGGFTLTHPGKAPVVLGPLAAPYRFSGEEPTHCVGTATDFNLMLKGVSGEMGLATGCTLIRPGLNAFYAPESRSFTVAQQVYALEAGQMLVIFADGAGEIDLGQGQTLVCYAAI